MRRLGLTALALAAPWMVLAAPAHAGGFNVGVSIADGKLKIDATQAEPTPMSTEVDYVAVSDEWRVTDPFAIGAGGGCFAAGPGAVECPEDGESIDVKFSTEGGSVSFAPADASLDFDSTIALGDGSDAVLAGNGVDVITNAAPATVSGDEIDTLAGDDQITTGDGSDVIGAGLGDDVVSGGGGDDQFDSGGTGGPAADGADTYNGGAGTDTVSYAGRTFGIDADIGGGANDGQGTGGGGCPTGVGCEDDDIKADVENLTGGSSIDTLTGDGDANVLDGGAGTSGDVLAGGTSAGPDGADTFIGRAGSIFGDEVTYAARTDEINADMDGVAGDDTDGDTVGADIEHLTGGSAGDTLTGNAAENELRGGPGTGNDTLSGLNEDDEFSGGTGQNAGPDGADVFIAGGQALSGDTVSYQGRTGSITADIGGGADDADGDDVQAQIDNLGGGGGDDTLTGNADPNRLFGGDGDDLLAGGTGAGPDGADNFSGGGENDSDTVTYATRTAGVSAAIGGGPNAEGDSISFSTENITGGSGDDTLTGDDEDNVLDGGDGDDTLAGGNTTGNDGRDTFIGQDHSILGDTVTYAPRADAITAGIGGAADSDGDDVREDIENLAGGDGNDLLTGDADANALRGGDDGDDTLRGGPGPGPDGADTFRVGSGVSTNVDTVSYAGRTDDVTADIGGGADDVDGDDISSDADNLVGGSGEDQLTGDDDPNTVTGGGGSDDLFGLAGADILDTRDDGPDSADCGADTDTALIDSTVLDTPIVDCENVDDAPQTRITKMPKRKTTKRTATFKFDSPTGATAFECRLDGADENRRVQRRGELEFEPCTSPHVLTGLRRRRHKFEVRAIDGDGDPDISPAIFKWKIVRN